MSTGAEMRYRRATELMEAELGDELVALDEQRGVCFGFSSTATDIWRLLQAPRTIEELLVILTQDYDVDEATCREDVTSCLGQMMENGLVEAEPV
jgi:hypothetical protein